MWHCHFSKCFGDSSFLLMGFRVTFSLRDRKQPQSARCLQFGQSSMSWEQRVDPLRFFYCSVAKGLKSITLSSYQPEVVKNKSELMSSWVNGKRLPLNWSLALQHRRGLPCKASTVLHHRSVVLFLKTNNLIKSKKAVQRAGRT